jgi:hypothetical protein
LHIHEAEETHDERGLATASPSTDSNLLPSFDGKGNLLQDEIITARANLVSGAEARNKGR